MLQGDYTSGNRDAWDLVAGKYAAEVDEHVDMLQSGGVSLHEIERGFLGDLSDWCETAVHLQCSHGLDTLSLWNLGATRVVGLDLSSRMLAQARSKAARLDAPARWIEADVLAAPADLDETADLVYTGKGALPWVPNLGQWARVVRRILKAGAVLYIFEGHPLDWVWEPEEKNYVLRADGGDYFDSQPRPNRDFPGRAAARQAPPGKRVPEAVEFQWTLGQIVTSLVRVGLNIMRLEEHPVRYWPKYGRMTEDLLNRLPHTFSLLAKKPEPRRRTLSG